MRFWLIEVNNMQYVVLLASKRDTSDRHWKTFPDLRDAMVYKANWEENEWMGFIHKCEGNY